MSVFKMNGDKLMRFVEMYRESEFLWNANLISYRDRLARYAAYKKMAEEMNIPGFGPKEVAQKIKNIRTTYKQELVKIKKSEQSGCPPEKVYKPKVLWFKILHSFLKNIKGSTTNWVDKIEENGEDGIPLLSEIPHVEEDNKIQFHEVGKIFNINVKPSISHKMKRQKFMCKDVRASPDKHRHSSKINSNQGTPKHDSSKPTEFDLWAKSLAIQLNKMDVKRALRLQLKIQTLVTNERLAFENDFESNQLPQTYSEISNRFDMHSGPRHWQESFATDPLAVDSNMAPSPASTADTSDSVICSIYSLDDN